METEQENNKPDPSEIIGEELATKFNDLYNETLRAAGAAGLTVQQFTHHMLSVCQAGMVVTAGTWAEATILAYPEMTPAEIKGDVTRMVQQYTATFPEALNKRLDRLIQDIEGLRQKAATEQ